MKRKYVVAVVVAAACLAAAVWYFMFGPAAPQKSITTRPWTEAVFPEKKETEIRNKTRDTVLYSLKPFESPAEPTQMVLIGGEVEKLFIDSSFEVVFLKDRKKTPYRVEPGKSYAFQYDENFQLNFVEDSSEWIPPLNLAPYVPTPMDVAEKMLELAEVDSHDVLYDLGCGDGRIVVMAAKKYGARGVGIDIDPKRIQECRSNAKKAGVENLVEFREQDVILADFSEATVVALYLLTSANLVLRPLLEEQLEPGTRVITHDYKIPGWDEKEVNIVTLKSQDGAKHTIYLYRR